MPANTVKGKGIGEFIKENNIDLSDINFIRSLSTNSSKIEAAVELFKDKGISRFSSVDIGAVIFYPEDDLEKIKKRTQAALSYIFRHERAFLEQLNLPYSQYLRLVNDMTSTNMHKLLGFDIVDSRLERISRPIYKFRPSNNDWYNDVVLPHPIDEAASFGLGVIWRKGVVMEYVPPELTTVIYADESQKCLLEGRIKETLQKMFGVEFMVDENKENVIYPENTEAEYNGLKLRIQSMAIGSFLTNTLGLPIGGMYCGLRKELPKVEYKIDAFLEGYKFLMTNSRNRWLSVTYELAVGLSDLLKSKGIDARVNGKASPHCHIIETDD